jgi:undecaprenyl-diphosphatase
MADQTDAPRPGWFEDLDRLDAAVYAAIAATPTPTLDTALRRLSDAADHSKLSIAAAALLSVTGGSKGRHAAASGLASVDSAAAFAFATGVGQSLPEAGAPLRALATLVAYSRVHTGVHYPGDAVAGSVIGSVLAQLTTGVLERRRR